MFQWADPIGAGLANAKGNPIAGAKGILSTAESVFKSKTTANIAKTPVPVIGAPITPASAEVIQAQQDLRRQNLKKKGFASAIFAGDTGGWFPGNQTPSPTNPIASASGRDGLTSLGG